MNEPLKSLMWNDFRLVKAIADAKGMAGAAAELGLNHSTVFRRLGQIEAALGTKLFERRRGGYTLTTSGEEMARLAEEVDQQIVSFTRKVAGREIQPAGELRVATNDSLLIHLLTPLFARFQSACPDVRLDVVMGNPSLNLSKRDADVAIRATDRPPENLVGRRIAAIAWALYGRGTQFPNLDAPPAMEDLLAGSWVSLGDEFGSMKAVKAVRSTVPEKRLRYRANSVLAVAEAIEAGIGVGYLPCFVGDSRPSLVRLAALEPSYASDLWLLTHQDLRHSPRVRVFLDFMAAELAGQKRLMEGSLRNGFPVPQRNED